MTKSVKKGSQNFLTELTIIQIAVAAHIGTVSLVKVKQSVLLLTKFPRFFLDQRTLIWYPSARSTNSG